LIIKNDLSLRRNVQSPVRPRIESKIGFIVPQATTPTVPPIINSSDNDQTTRNDNSNYDSLVGSLKSDTITWKDQQSTVNEDFSRFFVLIVRFYSSPMMKQVMLKWKRI